MIYVIAYLIVSLLFAIGVGKMIAFGHGPDYDQRRDAEEAEALRQMYAERDQKLTLKLRTN